MSDLRNAGYSHPIRFRKTPRFTNNSNTQYRHVFINIGVN